MKSIGRGWQYTVYDIGNNRVLKHSNDKLTAYFVMTHDCFPYIRSPIWKFPRYYISSFLNSRDSLQKLREVNLDKKLFGNPKYLDNNLDYEQDKLKPLDKHLKNISLDEGKIIINKFVNFNKLLIQNNCIDKSFNIGKNSALDKLGNIVLSDIGELYFSKEAINKQISKKAWTAPYVLKYIPKKLRNYFIDSMEVIKTN